MARMIAAVRPSMLTRLGLAAVLGWAIVASQVACAGEGANTSAPVPDQPAANAPMADKPATMPLTSEFVFDSKAVGRSYRIQVSRPLQPPPPEGYPLLIHTDGFFFPVVATAAILASYSGGKPAIVVGINWNTEDQAQAFKFRNKDLTPVPTEEGVAKLPATPNGPPPKVEDFGGAEALYHFIVDELRPELGQRYKINPADQIYYGHSFGGLFGLHVLMNHPETFQTYVIASPSIWWANKVILSGEAGLVAKIRNKDIAPKILVMAGAREAFADGPPPPGKTLEEMQARAKEAAMVANAKAFAERLGKVPGAPGYQIRFEEIADEGHVSSIVPSIGRGVKFALKR